MKTKSYLKTTKIALDFGTANCVIMKDGVGIVLSEPTVVAISPKEKKLLAVGQEAKIMLGKVPEGIEARRPLQNGGIANYRLAQVLLKSFFQKTLGRVRLVKPEVIAAVPAGLTSVEERALTKALHSVGAGKIFLMPEPVAASIGATMPINTPTGNLIVNLGGGTAEVAVLSLNGIVSYASHRGAGDALNQSIVRYVKDKYGVYIGEQTAEDVKFKIGSAMPTKEIKTISVSGKNLQTGLPITISLNSNELVEPMRGVLDNIVNVIKKVLDKTSPELLSDITDRGMVLSGGTSLLNNLDEFLTKSIGIPAHVVEDPLTCVARGLNTALKNIEVFKRSVRSG
jgi:rod shape-determining protein MreB